MLELKVEDIQPVVRIANYHRVAANTFWDRSIPDPQLICIFSGSFEYIEPDQPVLCLMPGDILFIEPSKRHRFLLSTDMEEGWIGGMHFEFTPAGRWAADDYRLSILPDRITRVSDGLYLQQRFQHLAAVYESYLPYRSELVNHIAAEIVLVLAAYWQGAASRAARPSERMEAMLDYIREHLRLPLTRQSLAETFNLTPGYINQLFKVELGMSPSAVINRERLAKAYQLIDREGVTVSEAAFAVGFQDPFYFSRVFKEVYTIPPSQLASRRRRSGAFRG
jgi:AraC-like DNA-binding protein